MNILEKIIEYKHSEVKERARITPLERIQDSQRLYSVRDFCGALKNDGIRIIAEIKRRSPVVGDINMKADPGRTAEAYARNGAACISVLTDQHYFGGQLEFVQQVKSKVELPVLRKDFIITEYQVWESFHLGADAILLIADAIDVPLLKDLYQWHLQ
jgi:indole-3-glycerol phosphate synthase